MDNIQMGTLFSIPNLLGSTEFPPQTKILNRLLKASTVCDISNFLDALSPGMSKFSISMCLPRLSNTLSHSAGLNFCMIGTTTKLINSQVDAFSFRWILECHIEQTSPFPRTHSNADACSADHLRRRQVPASADGNSKKRLVTFRNVVHLMKND